MDKTITIRESDRADLPAILGLYSQLGQDDGRILDLETAQRLFDRIRAYPAYRLYLAVKNGQAVGVFGLLIMDNLGHLGQPSAIVEDVVVAPDLRGQGLGGHMMAHAAKVAREQGCYKIMLSSNLGRDLAHRFYEQLGFTRHGYSYWLNLDGLELNPGWDKRDQADIKREP